jgi:phage/plasmid-like protein (TIGR03299 family)
MSHNLQGTEGNERFIELAGNGRPVAWHHLGKPVVGRALTAMQALEEGDMNFRLKKFPLYADLSARDEAGNLRLKDGKPIFEKTVAIPGQWAITRQKTSDDPHERILGIVGDSYTLLQNEDLAAMIDAQGDRWHVETCGSLGYGETIFFAMALGSYEIAGDQIDSYAVVTDTRDGTGGLTIMDTPVRTVCQNTLSYGLAAATSKITLSHSLAVKAEATALTAVFARLKEIQAASREAMAHLAEIPIETETAKSIIDLCYPEPEMPGKVRLARSVDGSGVDTSSLLKGEKAWTQHVERVHGWREAVETGYHKFNDEFPQSAETGWALFNSITGFEDHERNARNNRTRAEASLFGDRALTKSRAFDLISQLG